MSADRLLTAYELAEMLTVPLSWVRDPTRSGAMPVVELGRYRRYRRDEVMTWLESCFAAGPADRAAEVGVSVRGDDGRRSGTKRLKEHPAPRATSLFTDARVVGNLSRRRGTGCAMETWRWRV